MVAQREARAEEERLRKKAAADAAFKAVVEQTEKQNNEEDELRMLRYSRTLLLSVEMDYSTSKTTHSVPSDGIVVVISMVMFSCLNNRSI